MKPKFRNFLLLTGSSMLAVSSASAQATSGTWDTDAAGDWTDVTKWLGDSAYAEGANNTATFGNVITLDRIINLNAPIAIGNITASDTTHNYTISGANILTLDRTDATKPTINVTQSGRTLTIGSQISGNDGLLKTGAGDLVMTGANNFTGGIEISGGRIVVFDNANESSSLGNASNVLTFTGNASLHNNNNVVSMPQGITINDGVTASITGAFGERTEMAGVLAGSGTMVVQGFSAGWTFEARNTANSFTGAIRIISGDSALLRMRSLADSANTIGLQSNGGLGGAFEYASGAIAPLVLNQRQFELITNGDAGTNTSRLPTVRNNAGGSNTITINTDLLITGTGAKRFVLGGSNTGANTFAGIIPNGVAGAALSLDKQDGGRWSLTNANNSYTGATTISAGTLVIGGAGRLGSGNYAGNISNAGTFLYSSSADQILSGIISGAGATQVHAGTLTFAGSSSGTLGSIQVGGAGTPVLNIQAGSYTQGAGGFFVGGGAGGAGIVNQTGGTVDWNNNGLQLLIGNGGFDGTYNLSGGSLTTLTGTNTRGVMIGVNNGSSATFNLSGTGALTVAGTSRLMIGRSDATQINTTNLFSQSGGTATISDMTMGGTSGGAGSGNSATMTLTGGTFTATAFSLLSAANNDVSTINIGGTAVVTLPNLPIARGTNATATINFDGGTLRNSGTGTFITGLTNAFIMDDGAKFDTSLNSTTISQALLTHGSSLGGGLTKLGANTLTLSGANTYTGTTTVTGGILKASVASVANTSGAFGNNSAVSLADTAGVSLDITGFNTQIGSLTGGGLTGGNVTLGAATLTVGGDNTSPAAYAGVISGTDGALTKIGSGTQILSGTNTYTGATNVNGGTLVVNGNISTSVFTTVAANAAIGGSGIIGALVIQTNGTVAPGNSPGIMNVIGNYTQMGLYEAEIEGIVAGNGSGFHDQINVTGDVDITGGSLTTLFSNFAPVNGDLIFILLNDGTDAITGTFTGLAQGAFVQNYNGFDFFISYDANGDEVGFPTFTGGNDIALRAVSTAVDVIPEPSTALLGALGALLLFRRRR